MLMASQYFRIDDSIDMCTVQTVCLRKMWWLCIRHCYGSANCVYACTSPDIVKFRIKTIGCESNSNNKKLDRQTYGCRSQLNHTQQSRTGRGDLLLCHCRGDRCKLGTIFIRRTASRKKGIVATFIDRQLFTSSVLLWKDRPIKSGSHKKWVFIRQLWTRWNQCKNATLCF